MSRTVDDLVRIAAAGGGMKVPSHYSTDDLVRIAATASSKGSQITIAGASERATDDLVRIAAAGKGCVVFKFEE